MNIDELVLGPGLANGQVRGLLGIADRDPTNDLTPSTGGGPVSPDIDPTTPPYEQPLYREFGRSWPVTTSRGPSETLFDYLDPGHPEPASYENELFPSEQPRVVDGQARAICEESGVTVWPQSDFCTYDVEVTGAREITRYYRGRLASRLTAPTARPLGDGIDRSRRRRCRPSYGRRRPGRTIDC